MNSKTLKFLFLFFISVSLLGYAADGNKKDLKELSKTQGTPVRTFLNINNVSTQIYNDGNSDITPDGNSGVIFPKGSGKTAVFESGFIWGAYVAGDPQVRVGGSTYRQGIQAGKIISPGVAESPDLPKNRIYRVRPDVYPGGPAVDLSVAANEEGQSESALRAQYETDWNEWPVADGAPFDDKNGNGIYEPTIDVPGVKGADQTVWFVANDQDPTKATYIYGTNPLGIEMQATIWAYAQTGALGNMFFRKYKIINKSNVTFDSMYVSMWSDVDLGNATDDFAGCDTSLSLGYVYNANASDDTYKPLPPPAVGFDFFQGPLLTGVAGQDRNKNGVDDASDYGIFDGKVVGPGKFNLPMTAFYYFARGDASVTDPTLGAPQGSTQFYNFMQGKIGLTGQYFVDPNTNQPTTYVLSGDPQTRTGWIDGQLIPAGDRRIGSASGPFQMAPGDTQEVVVAEICAGAIPGTDRLSAIGLLKFYDQQAQLAYDNFFNLPVAPPAPEINVVELDREIILDWGENQSKVNATETADSKGYKFQGYNVYQLPSASSDVTQGKRIATYDIVDGIGKIEDFFFDANTGVVAKGVRQFGNDTGIKRFISIKNDELNGGTPLINGIRYYYAVTSYSYNSDPQAVPNNLENPLTVITVVPSSLNPGVTLGAQFQDTLAAVRVGGSSDGFVYPMVVDPTKLTGLTYTVKFEDVGGNIVWHLDRSDGVRVLSNQTNQAADDLSPIVDGIQVKVIGAPNDFKLFSVVANGAGPLATPEPGAFAFAEFPTPHDGPGAGNPAAGVQQSTNNSRWGIHTADNGSRGLYSAFLSRTTRDGANWPSIIPYDFEIRFTAAGGWAYDAFNTGTLSFAVPFELWNIGINTPNDASDDVRMIPWLLDDDANGAFNMGAPGAKQFGTYDHTASSAENDPYTDWIYWVMPENSAPGQAGYLDAQAKMQAQTYDGGNDHEVMARMVLVNWNGGTAPPYNADLPETGTIFRITSTKPNAANSDVFSFTSPAPVSSNELAKKDVDKVNVFPNPYYGANSEELNKYNRFVTFSHLPTKATIRIYNLAGVLVREIDKNSTSQFERWDLANNSGLPVASGLYIAYIDMPEVGKTKILKLAIIQEQQILDRF
ncbi:MAG: T9SS type A sorting domain-containing protein [Ignavibacteriaceae bacterium]|nr:T9SS type A sorting domain-containing protein [Ignavibacteriaceae bacterium]